MWAPTFMSPRSNILPSRWPKSARNGVSAMLRATTTNRKLTVSAGRILYCTASPLQHQQGLRHPCTSSKAWTMTWMQLGGGGGGVGVSVYRGDSQSDKGKLPAGCQEETGSGGLQA